MPPNTNSMEKPMRTALALALAITISAATASAWAEDAKAPVLAAATQKCDNPKAWGVERVVQIDTTGAPGFSSWV